MVDRFMQTARMEDDIPIESKMVSRSIASAQSQVEGRNFEIRKNVLKYDDVMNRQRTVIYDEAPSGPHGGRHPRAGPPVHQRRRRGGYVDSATAEGFPETWDLDQLWTAIGTLFPCQLTPRRGRGASPRVAGPAHRCAPQELLTSEAHHAYDAREASVGEETMRELERRVILSVLDRRWREHLYEMDYLQEGIGLRAMAQRDPVEYQREGFDLFNAMMEAIKEEAVGYLYNVEVQVEPAPPAPAVEPMTVQQLLAGAAGSEGVADAIDAGAAGPGCRTLRSTAVAPHPARASGRAAVPAGPEHLLRPRADPGRPQRLHYSAPSADGGVVEHDEGPRRPARRRAGPRRRPVGAASGRPELRRSGPTLVTEGPGAPRWASRR